MSEAKAKFEMFRDAEGQWRWHLIHDNGNIVADSGEGYTSKQNCRNGIESVKRNAADAPVVELE